MHVVRQTVMEFSCNYPAVPQALKAPMQYFRAMLVSINSTATWPAGHQAQKPLRVPDQSISALIQEPLRGQSQLDIPGYKQN